MIRDSAFYGSLLPSAFVATVLLCVVLLADLDAPVRIGLGAMALIVLAQWYHDNYVLALKAYQHFGVLSFSICLKAACTFLLTALLLYLFGIYGAFLVPLLALIPVLAYLRAKSPVGERTHFDISVFSRLVKEGFPIMLYNFGAILLSTSDRIVISYFLGNEPLGYYGIAVMVFGIMRQIPGTAREVIEPDLMQRMESHRDARILRDYLFTPLLTTAYLMPFLVGSAFFLVPAVIPLALPRYVPGIAATQIIVFGCYFLALAYSTRGLIVAHNWQLSAAVITGIVLLTHVVLSSVLIRSGFGIEGVALSCGVSQLLLFLCSFLFLRKKCARPAAEWRTTAGGILLAFLGMSGTIALLQLAFTYVSINAYIDPLIKVLLFFGAMILVTKRARARLGILQDLPFRAPGHP
jgi:O-antigen/teichoic acid export membrane protein